AVAPLLVSSFAFNFNNFNAIELLTEGGPFPDGSGRGATDILISMVYRIAFGGSGADFGFASAVSVCLFVLTGVLRRPVPIHQRPRGRQLSPRKGSTMSSTTAPQQGARRRMPFHRWFAELGWRHIVGVLAIAFAVFPIMFVVSASLNESGSIAAAGLLPTEGVTLEHYAVMLSGERANFLRWYLNTIIVCGVVA